jgi:diguanylate cyclase
MDMKELHWLLDIIHSIDVGVIVLDTQYRVKVWNAFMENHSGIAPDQVQDKPLFALFPEIPRDWFQRKFESVLALGNRAFTIWEQRPYLVKFRNYQPITGVEEHMFQNVSIIPLTSATGTIEHVCVIIYDVTDIATSKRQLQHVNETLEQLSRTDRLTQLYNRGYWEECLAREFARHKRYHSAASLVMFDIDHFKKVNDTYGHQVGDKVIQLVSALLKKNLRSIDVAGRYGGEEFGAILPDTDLDGAKVFAERLRENAQALSFRAGEHEVRFTISLGVADLNEPCPTHKQWIEHADRALYESKHAGRNRVSIYVSAA